MKKNSPPKDDSDEKSAYHFGTYQKIILDPKELETTVYAVMHGVDMCDPRIGTVCSPQ